MASLADNEVFIAPRTAVYLVSTVIGTGTTDLELSLDQGATYNAITDASWSASATSVLELTEGAWVRAQLTGDAVLQIDA